MNILPIRLKSELHLAPTILALQLLKFGTLPTALGIYVGYQS